METTEEYAEQAEKYIDWSEADDEGNASLYTSRAQVYATLAIAAAIHDRPPR